MSTKFIRLDAATKKTQLRLRSMTDRSVSKALKQGLTAYEQQGLNRTRRKPYEIYRELDLGEGRYAISPAREAKSAIAIAFSRKHRR